MMVVLGFVIFAITSAPGGSDRTVTSTDTSNVGPNAANLSVSATLTEPTGSSTAIFTLFIGNFGDSTLEGFSAYLVGPDSQHFVVPLGQSSLPPHGVASGELSLGFSCIVGEAYAYVLSWVYSNMTRTKQSAVTCALA